MSCGCNKAKKITTVNKTINTSAAQKKVAQNLPLISVKKAINSTPTPPNKISKRQ